jgi:hypothetical protein
LGKTLLKEKRLFFYPSQPLKNLHKILYTTPQESDAPSGDIGLKPMNYPNDLPPASNFTMGTGIDEIEECA